MSHQNSVSPPALSNPKRSAFGGATWLFAIVFLGVGLTVAYFVSIRPMLGMWRARSWIATPCKIVSSELKRLKKSNTRVAIVFSYSFAQKDFRSDQYCFAMMSSNTAGAWKRKVVADHPPGKQTTCFVNPDDPGESVIERGWVPDMWWGLFPIPFVLIGFGALLAASGVIRVPNPGGPGSLSSWRPKPLVDPSTLDSLDATFDASRSVTLRPEATPLQMLIGTMLIAAFWNGVVSVFVSNVIQQFQRGGFVGINWFEAILLIPFVAIGIGLFFYVVYRILALTNPRPTLVVTPGSILLGEEVNVSWSLSGRTASIDDLKISLKGLESATYRRGKGTTTETSTFAKVNLLETNQQFEIEAGSVAVTIPADSMHSFDAPNNKITWVLEVRGRIRWWPDVSASFPITVLPMSQDQSQEDA